MKVLSQFMELYLPGGTAIQLILAIGLIALFMKILLTRFYRKMKHTLRCESSMLENDMWAIE